MNSETRSKECMRASWAGTHVDPRCSFHKNLRLPCLPRARTIRNSGNLKLVPTSMFSLATVVRFPSTLDFQTRKVFHSETFPVRRGSQGRPGGVCGGPGRLRSGLEPVLGRLGKCWGCFGPSWSRLGASPSRRGLWASQVVPACTRAPRTRSTRSRCTPSTRACSNVRVYESA